MMSFWPEKTFTLKDIGRPPTASAKAAEAAALSAAGELADIEVEPPRIVMHDLNELEPVPAELVARKLLDTAKQVTYHIVCVIGMVHSNLLHSFRLKRNY